MRTTKRELIERDLKAGASVSDIVKMHGCCDSYVYQVRKKSISPAAQTIIDVTSIVISPTTNCISINVYKIKCCDQTLAKKHTKSKSNFVCFSLCH